MIKKWILKAIVQKTISFLPGSHKINFFFQKYVTKGVHLSDAYFEDRLIHARKHLQSFNKYAKRPLEQTLELGTGWYPVVPIAMFLRGAKKINTVDISGLTDKAKLLTTINRFLEYHSSGQLKEYISPREDKIKVLEEIILNQEERSFHQILQTLNINYLVMDIRKIPLEEKSIDLIHSNNTFEHVYPEVLKGILKKFKQLVHPQGIQSHFIDMSDHFAHFDHSINIYNFLRFSDQAWKRIDNSVQPQNRWRMSEYEILYKELGINISEIDARKGDLEALGSIKLAEKYTSFDSKDLAISHAYVISQGT